MSYRKFILILVCLKFCFCRGEKVMEADARYQLAVCQRVDQLDWKRISLFGNEAIIGRDPFCHVKIDDEYSSVSRRHASIFLEENPPRLIDMSRNGTFVNGRRIDVEQLLAHGDRISLPECPAIIVFADLGTAISTAKLRELIDESDMPIKGDFFYCLNSTNLERRLNLGPLLHPEEDLISPEDMIKILGFMGNLEAKCDTEELLCDFLRVVFEIFAPDRGFVMAVDNEGKLVPVSARTRIPETIGTRLALSKSLLKEITGKKQAILIPDVSREPGFANCPSLKLHNIKSILCVPIVRREKLLGLVQLDQVSSWREFNLKDLNLLAVLCHQIAVLIENINLFQRMRREENLCRYLPGKLVDAVLSGKVDFEMGGRETEVAVWFSDIRGFSEIASQLTPSETLTLLNDYFEELSDMIFKHAGIVLQFVGDCIMAIFGGPWTGYSEERAVESALMASVDVMRRLKEINEERSLQGKRLIRIGIGINFGKVILGNIGTTKKMEFTALGDTTNRAARLCGEAGAGEILISESVVKKLGKPYPLQDRGEILVKNIPGPLRVFSLKWEEVS